MILDPNFYRTTEAVKFQRQATPYQKKFIDLLRESYDDDEYGYDSTEHHKITPETIKKIATEIAEVRPEMVPFLNDEL